MHLCRCIKATLNWNCTESLPLVAQRIKNFIQNLCLTRQENITGGSVLWCSDPAFQRSELVHSVQQSSGQSSRLSLHCLTCKTSVTNRATPVASLNSPPASSSPTTIQLFCQKRPLKMLHLSWPKECSEQPKRRSCLLGPTTQTRLL